MINQNESDIHFKVTGIVRDIDKTHIPVNYFIAITSEGDASYFRSEVVNSEWAGMQFVIAYVKLAPHHNKEHVVKKINDVLQRHGEEDMKALQEQGVGRLFPPATPTIEIADYITTWVKKNRQF